MTITTKYDIGQEVWVIIQDTKKCTCCGTLLPSRWVFLDKYTIEAVESEQDVHGCTRTTYGLAHTKNRDESVLFPTKAEAQAECDRRNKETNHV